MLYLVKLDKKWTPLGKRKKHNFNQMGHSIFFKPYIYIYIYIYMVISINQFDQLSFDY
jgi:hypothetical protein